MNWVALDRGIRLSEKRSLPADHSRWIMERDHIYEQVMEKGWNEKRGAFTQYYGRRRPGRFPADHASGVIHGTQ